MPQFSPPSAQMLENPLLEALRAWHQEVPDHLLEELQLVRTARNQLKDTPLPPSPGELRRLTNQVLLEALETLETQDVKGFQLLRERFIYQKSVRQAAASLNLSEDQIKKRQRQAITRLAEGLYVQEQTLRASQERQLEAQLPPPTYSRLFGITTSQTTLTELLLAATPPWIIALVGMGGMGKTALAHALARALVHTFGPDQILWVQAPVDHLLSPSQTYENLMLQIADGMGISSGTPPSRLQQVRYRLKQSRYLIILDNLESEAETSYLLGQLYGLADPTHFLVTTRSYPPALTGVFFHRMAELSLEEATAFLRHHSESLGLGSMALTNPEDARAIYAFTGGNPLALKLVTGLVAIFPLIQVLEDLTQSRAGEIEDLYRHIYWKAWQALTPEAQALLRTMPLVAPSGALPAQMQAMSELEEIAFWPALQALVTRSLVEVQGTVHDRRYGIHALTRTFLQTEIIRWPPKEPRA